MSDNSDSSIDVKMKEIQDFLESTDKMKGSVDSLKMIEMLYYCMETINKLQDENSSLWLMLDEIKRAEIENFSEEFRKMMDRKLVELKLLALQKPGQA